MTRTQIAPGAYLTQLPGDKFKRARITVHLVAPGRRDTATTLAVLPHVLERRCKAIPDPTALSRRLFGLYGAELNCESYTAGANRVLSAGVSGLKNAYSLASEDLAGEYLDLLCNLLFEPYLENGVFAAQDVGIETEKQADYLNSEMNDKRSYCLRQARRKLYGDSPLGIESPGYLEDLPGVTPESLYAGYLDFLKSAQIEAYVCGADADAVAARLARRLEAVGRAPVSPATAPPLAKTATFEHYAEAMATAQGKLAIVLNSGLARDGRGDAVMRLAGALYGGLPTSRLFMNVREKQSLCYYCAAAYAFHSGTLTVDSGIDHKDAKRAAEAILQELTAMQSENVSAQELENGKRALQSAFTGVPDNPDSLMAWAFNEWLRGTNRRPDEVARQVQDVSADEVREALAAFTPSVEYLISEKEGEG